MTWLCHSYTGDQDFKALACSVVKVERMNSDLAVGGCRRGPARNMSQEIRRDLIHQSAVVHRDNGGKDPLAPGGYI